MDEVLLAASRLALLVTGVGGSLTVLISAVRRRVGTGWLPTIAAAAILLLFPLTSAPPASFWGQQLMLIPWFIGFPLLAATFPDGRFVPRWSVVVVAASVVGLVVNAALADEWRRSGWWTPFAVGQLVAIVFVVSRYRRSATTSERESVRWMLLGLVVTVSAYALIQLVDGAIGEGGSLATAKADAAAIPLMLGLVIGLVRPARSARRRPRPGIHRMWDISVDAAFRAVLLVIFGGFALAAVWAAVRSVVIAAGGDPVAAAGWGAAAVGVLAYPVVRGAAHAATWLVFRDRLDPATAVTMLAASLDGDDQRSAAQRVVDAAAAATGSPEVRLCAASRHDAAVFDAVAGGTRPGGTDDMGAATAPPKEWAVGFHGEVLATLAALPRHGESELTPRDRAVLSAIAQHCAPALHGARALREATDAQRALVTAREEERRRLRRELHDDLGPALAGIALSAAALAQHAHEADAGLAEAVRELQTDIGDAVTRSREISHGLRPPILDDGGLEAALRARLGVLQDVVLDVGALGDLPAAVDLAALRIVQEAVTNVRRHAAASVCRVDVERDAAGLRIAVRDDGIGMPAEVIAGMGLRSIRERADELGGRARISRAPGGGTLVTVQLPLAAAGEETG